MNFLQAMHDGLEAALDDKDVLVCGQLVKYGLGGLTTGLYDKFPQQVITFPTCENLMNAAAMGLALAGKRVVVVHERMDFLAVGMDPLVNHLAVWPSRAKMSLPVVIFAVIGKGKGQGPQHSKNLTPWFKALEGWTVVEPKSPDYAKAGIVGALYYGRPVLYVAHREFFNSEDKVVPPRRSRVGLCGASKRHEALFYSQMD